jgi:phage gpG-like protein
MVDAVDVQGADRLAGTLHDAADELKDLSDVNAQAGEYIRSRAAANAPRSSGRLAASLSVRVEPAAVTVESDVVYANPIHWGWKARNISAQPFLSDALEATSSTVVDMYAANNERILSHVHGI